MGEGKESYSTDPHVRGERAPNSAYYAYKKGISSEDAQGG